MQYYEIIYEPGTKSVACYEDDAEAESAIKAHHERALSGVPGTPQSTPRADLNPGEVGQIGTWAAERIKRVYVYEQHPADYAGDQLVSKDEVQKAFESAVEASSLQDAVHVPTVAAALRETSSAVVFNPGPHDSQFKMDAVRELDLGFLKEVEG